MTSPGSSNNFYNGYNMQANFANYMNSMGNLSAYSAYRSANYPLFHSAAVAAVAAAAAGYSQFGNPSPVIPLNLSNLTGIQEVYANPLYGSGEAQLKAAGYGGAPVTTRQQQASSFHAPVGLGVRPQPTAFVKASPDGNGEVLLCSTPTKARSHSKRNRKVSATRTGAEDTATNQKKREFEQLVKARTDKLLSDGPIYNLPNSIVPVAPSGVPASMEVRQAKLLRTIIDAKVALLLSSPEVVFYLENQQHLVEQYKRKTELFSVTISK